ncbi:ribosomal protein S18-alanine N-acetyltransferase [Pseudotabrizicola algicola]|nr:ribosomal protein S18-alanine N-acetyltransferase [Pseudotabrizicola algicola]
MPDIAALAAIHAACFTLPRPWSAAEIESLLGSPEVFALVESSGFLMGRVVADEAEMLTLAVMPDARRTGMGRSLVQRFVTEARVRGAAQAFLEVAASNCGAIALYRQAGFVEVGRRKGYYSEPDGTRVDALVLSRAL